MNLRERIADIVNHHFLDIDGLETVNRLEELFEQELASKKSCCNCEYHMTMLYVNAMKRYTVAILEPVL